MFALTSNVGKVSYQLTHGAMHLMPQSEPENLGVRSHACLQLAVSLTSPWLPGRQWFAKYYESAISLSSPEMDEICSVAAENNVLLSIGIIEKERGTLYCTAILIDRTGNLLSSHRKVQFKHHLMIMLFT